MRKPELAAAIAEQADITKDKANEVVTAITDIITKAMAEEDTVSLIGFGTFSQRQRAARVGKNPQTGEAIQIAASKTVAFKPGKGLKEAVNTLVSA